MSEKTSIRHLALTGFLGVALATCGSAALASGSFSGSSQVGAQNSYNMGKALVHKKIVCDDCPKSKMQMNRDEASELVRELQSDQGAARQLDRKEREAAIHYLRKRFDLS